jgi:hypothetical protein
VATVGELLWRVLKESGPIHTCVIDREVVIDSTQRASIKRFPRKLVSAGEIFHRLDRFWVPNSCSMKE